MSSKKAVMSGNLGVIFDVDGVLVDSYAPHYESWRLLGREVGFEMTEEQFVRTFGRTSREIIRDFWPDRAADPSEVIRLDNRKEELYRELISKTFPPMDGAVDLIDALAADGFLLAVGSSGPPPNVTLTIEKLGRSNSFSAVVTGQDVTRGKPEPEVFQVAARRLGLAPDRCAVIEDAPAGVAAALAAGTKCIGLCTAGRDVVDLSRADLVVKSLRELNPAIIRSLIARPC